MWTGKKLDVHLQVKNVRVLSGISRASLTALSLQAAQAVFIFLLNHTVLQQTCRDNKFILKILLCLSAKKKKQNLRTNNILLL